MDKIKPVSAAALRTGETGETGDPGTTRTPNILIRSQVLYPVELRDRWRLL
jgi:hypothetical protein